MKCSLGISTFLEEISSLSHSIISHYFFALIIEESEIEVTQSCLTLCRHVDCSPPSSSVHGILQARTLEWIAISFSRGSSPPRDWTQVSHTAGRRFNLCTTREAQWPLRKAFLPLLAILWNSAFRWVYLSFSPLLLSSLLFTAIFKACSLSRFDFLHFFFLGMVLIPVFWTNSQTSIHSSSGTLSIRSTLLNLFLTSTV